MTKKAKRLEKVRQNPKTVSYEDLKLVLEDQGFQLDRSSGSHFHFILEIEGNVFRISVPYQRPFIKAAYIRESLKVIEQIQDIKSEQEADDEQN